MNTNYNILYLQKIQSTNVYAMGNLAELPDRQVIVADIQTNGRGRFERKWVSDKPNNVYMSIVLKNLPLTNLTFQMAEAVRRTLKIYGVDATIKEPNDVMVNNKKICGVLCQSSTRGDTLNGIVLGVGVNLNLSEHDLERIDQPASALNLILGQPVDRDLFIKQLLDEFFAGYHQLSP